MSGTRRLVVVGLLTVVGCNPGGEQAAEVKEAIGDLREEVRDVREEIRSVREEIRDLRKSEVGKPIVNNVAEAKPLPTPESNLEPLTAPPTRDPPPAQATVKISLQSNPAGAKVFVGNRFIGVTPVLVQTEPGSGEMRILVEKEGYRARVMTLRPEEDTKISVQLAKK